MGKLKIAVVTGCDCGMASFCLPRLVDSPALEVVSVNLALPARRMGSVIRRKIRKIAKIGLLGAVNGIRIRKWYSTSDEPLESLCARLAVPFRKICGLNSVEMQERLKGCDLALSLGNDYIAERVFSVPRLGMINVHSEILPAYQNAQSVIWPIYCNDPFSGFTIHEVSKRIDAGRILFQKRVPIVFRKHLGDTVRATRAAVDRFLPEALVTVCERIEEFKATAREQTGGCAFTTPSLWQFIRMERNNRRYWKHENDQTVD